MLVVLPAELDEDGVVAVEVVAAGIAGIWAVLRAAQPARQEEASIATITDALLPI